MERSLLMLLEKEHDAVKSYNEAKEAKRYMDIFEKEIERISNIPFDCNTKMEDIATCVKHIAYYQNEAMEHANEIVRTRGEIKKYLKDIF